MGNGEGNLQTTSGKATIPATNGLGDLLGNAFADLGLSTPAPAVQQHGGGADDMDIFGISSSTSKHVPQSSPSSTGIPPIVVLNSKGVTVKFDFERAASSDQPAVIRMTVTNGNGTGVENFNFQAAVTKAYQVEILPPSGTLVPANNSGTVQQTLKVTRISHGQPLRMKLKAAFLLNGLPQLVQGEVNQFPSLW